MKNKLQKIFSAAIAMMMLFSCFSLTSFAASDSRTHIYELYQIFTGTASNEGILSDVQWGINGKKPTSGEPDNGDVSSAVLSELKAVVSGTDSEKLAVIKKYVDFDSTPYRGENEQPVKNDTGNGYKYSGVTPGYYLIKDKNGTQTGENGIYTLYVVEVSGSTLTFEPKGNVPTVDKKINDNGQTSSNSASIGEDVNYEITGSVSSRIADYATYYYKFTDTLSNGLTYKADSLKVYLKNGDREDDVTKYFYVNASNYSEITGTTITVTIKDLKALNNASYTVDSTSKVLVKYTATLNEKALVKDPNINEVYVTYSNDPNNSGTPTQTPPEENPPAEPTTDNPVGETVKSKTETYTTALVITKTNVGNEKLQGAVFTLTGNGVKQVLVTELAFKEDASGNYYKLKEGTYTTVAPTPDTKDNYQNPDTKYVKTTSVTLKGESQNETNVKGEVDENGVVIFTGLGEGDYTLTETKAPIGYNRMDPINFNIRFDRDLKTFISSYGAIAYNELDGKMHSTIINYPGSSLPHTGGIGTTIFYVIGSVLVIGTTVLLIAKKRMNRENI